MLLFSSGWSRGLAALAATLICGAAFGQTVVYVDRSAPGVIHDGASWCTAFLDLQPTLITAAAGTEIRVANGRYTPQTPPASVRTISFALKSGVTIFGGYAGCGAMNPDERDFTLYETILSGDLMGNDGPSFANRADNSYNVVRGEGADATAILDGFTISGGNANGTNPLDRGGGIRNYFTISRAIFRNLVIRDNEAGNTRGGGGIYNDHTLCQYINCLITGNRAIPGITQGNGGGVLNNGATHPDGIGSEATFRNCAIVGNHARVGGGIYNDVGARPNIENSVLWGNTHNGFVGVFAQINSVVTTTMRYSHVQDLTTTFFPDPTNSALNPLFVDIDGADGILGTADDDLRLSDDSPCINAGDPATVVGASDVDLANAPRLVGCRVDIGVHESAIGQLFADFNADSVVDLRDFSAFQHCFGTPTTGFSWSPACLCTFDSQPDGSVDLPDVEAFRQLITGP